MSNPTCFEVIGELDEAMRMMLPEDVNYYVLGGIASAALQDPATHLNVQDSEVVARPSAEMSVMRDNETRRDIDILVGSVVPQHTRQRIHEAVSAAVDGQL